MSSKRRIRRKACDGKKRYETCAAAVSASTATGRNFGGLFNAYHCQFCRGWHVGHIPRTVKHAFFEPYGHKGRRA